MSWHQWPYSVSITVGAHPRCNKPGETYLTGWWLNGTEASSSCHLSVIWPPYQCFCTRMFSASSMHHKPGGFGFELASAVLALHDHCKGKEDEGWRLWKKAWGFNLFPMFISPPGDKPCAIKNISYSRWSAARPHLWRHLKDKIKGTKKRTKKKKSAERHIGVR